MRWKVPITIATKSNPAAVKIVLEKESDTVTVEGVDPNEYILVRLRSLIEPHVVGRQHVEGATCSGKATCRGGQHVDGATCRGGNM